jgi:DNA-binding response OmpR family regulator
MEPALKDEFQFDVLVVDDDPAILTLMKEILSMVPGCRILVAPEPREAMKEVVKGGVDIIFTDIHMPNHSGFEFLQDLVALQQTPEVIIMTAHPNGEHAIQAMELGALSLIEKPFADIAVVEGELQKAIKRILRQRALDREVQLKKLELSKRGSKEVDNDEALRVSVTSFGEPGDTPTPSDISGISSEVPSHPPMAPAVASAVPAQQANLKLERKVYEEALLLPLVEIEVARSKRYNRQFAIGIVDLPEPEGAKTTSEKSRAREIQLAQLERVVRKSDVLIDLGRDGVGVVGFECNKVGSEVLEAKLRAQGFEYSGFAIHPSDGNDGQLLKECAKSRLQNKRKLQIVVFEAEDFFGRLVQNMLMDPKYHVVWTKTLDEMYKYILDESESVKLLVLSLSRDKEQWKMMAQMLKEGLVRWPILLFVDVPLTNEVKTKLSKLGVRAIVNKSASQEEFIYLVQSFVIPKPFGKERKNYRALVALPVTFKQNGQVTHSNTFTLSRDGLFVRDLNPPQSGEIVELELYTPANGVMKTRAEVIYAVPYFVGVARFHVAGFALKFIDLTPVQRDQIDVIVSNSMTSYLI